MNTESAFCGALFDLDGVIIDTETQYTQFWKEIGKKYFPEQPTFATDIKGSTLTVILQTYFGDNSALKQEVESALLQFETHMKYDYIAGVARFVAELRNAGVKTAIVTSSNHNKMKQVFAAHPDFKDWFNEILTAEAFSKSKPHPDCYLKAAGAVGVDVERCVVFEDSRFGLEAGRAAQMKVVGLATTLPENEVKELSDVTISDFQNFKLEDFYRLLNNN